MRRAAWVLFVAVSVLVWLYGLLRFSIELGESPLHYVIEDALFIILGVLGIGAGLERLQKLAILPVAATPPPLPPGFGLPGGASAMRADLEVEKRELPKYLAWGVLIGATALFCALAFVLK